MAERTQDGGETTVEQAERPEQAEPAEQEQPELVEPERRPTYKTLDEQQGRLTEAEERFERGRRTIGLFLGPLVFLLLLGLPPGLDGKQQALAMVKTGAVFDVIGAVLCVVGVAVMANVVGLV